MKKFFSTQPIWYDEGLFVVRLILGLFMVYHGWEIFDKTLMDGYVNGDMLKNGPSPAFMAYLGKGAELVGGIMLVFGWLTRVAALIIVLTMARAMKKHHKTHRDPITCRPFCNRKI